MAPEREVEKWMAIGLVAIGWAFWAVACNAFTQRLFPTRVSDDGGRRFIYSLLTRGLMLAPFLAIAAYMSWLR
jgi:hypothetical protein